MALIKRTKNTRLAFFLFTDILSVFLATCLSFFIRFDYQIPYQYLDFILIFSIATIVLIIPIFYFKRLYSFSWSYVSTNELVSIFQATTVTFILLGIVVHIAKYFNYFQQFPRSTVIISYTLVFLFTSAARISKRVYVDIFQHHNIVERERTLIVGAGDTGEQILRNIMPQNSPYSPVGFVDDSSIKQGVKIHGVRVLGRISDIPNIVKQNNIKKIIIALPSASNKAIRESIELSRQAGIINIKIAPSLSKMIKGESLFKNLRNVDVEDLLGRESVNLDKKQLEEFIKGKSVLVTGAAGSIGSELAKQIAVFNPSVIILLDQDETGIFNISRELHRNISGLKIESVVADIKDEEKINNVFSQFKPQLVFHAAAYKHVPLMEHQPDEAVKNNILGTEILVKQSLESNVEKFVFISTDKAVNPTSVMGATKRIGEMICQIYNNNKKTKFVSVRFGNVLDSRGSVIPIFRDQIKKGGPIEVTHPDMQRYFMLTSEACLLVLQAGAMGQGGEVFVLDMGKPVKILDLAKEMIKLSGFEVDKDIAITFIGIRPGEKLFEEMLTAEEGTIVTQNNKIFMAKMSQFDFDGFKGKINHLITSINKIGEKEIIDSLKEITPYYLNSH